MSALLDKSLDELRKPSKSNGPRRSRGGGRSSLSRQDSSPYSRPAPASGKGSDSWQHDMYNTEEGSSRSHREPRGGNSSDASNKLRIENLHYEVSEAELASLFSQMGELEKPPSIQFDRSGRSEGIAHVIFKNEKDAMQAKSSFDGANAKGQPIKITYDFSWKKPTEAPELLSRLQGGSSLFKNEPARGSFAAKSSRARGGFALRGRGGQSSGRGRGGKSGRENTKAAPKSSEDLDAELDKFMSADVDMS